jgi:hypothetical protein
MTAGARGGLDVSSPYDKRRTAGRTLFDKLTAGKVRPYNRIPFA